MVQGFLSLRQGQGHGVLRLGHTGTTGSHRGAENRVGGLGGSGKGCSSWSQLDGGMFGGICGWEGRDTFYGRLGCGFVGKVLLPGSPWQISMKRDSLWSQIVCCRDEK